MKKVIFMIVMVLFTSIGFAQTRNVRFEEGTIYEIQAIVEIDEFTNESNAQSINAKVAFVKNETTQKWNMLIHYENGKTKTITANSDKCIGLMNGKEIERCFIVQELNDNKYNMYIVSWNDNVEGYILTICKNILE